MPHMQLDWHASFELAAALVVVSLLLRLIATPSRLRPLVPATLQAAMLVALYGLWGLVGAHAEGKVAGAEARGRWLWDIERTLHLVSERQVQSLLLPHELLTQVANAYYVYGHVNLVIATLAWVWFRHREAYLRLCVVLFVFTTMSTATQLISVAPPRLLPGDLVVDTAIVYGQSVYGPADPGAISQLAAMPSIHVGWALLISLTVVRSGRTRWRWLSLTHAVGMSVVVVVTGNHYWLDGIASAVLLALALGLVEVGARALASGRRRRARPADRVAVTPGGAVTTLP